MTDRPRLNVRTLGVVAIGGALGVAVRAAIVVPAAVAEVVLLTLMINVVGSLLLGVIVGALGDRHPRCRAFLGTGVMGGFTTYSAFAVQTVQLAQSDLLGAGGLVLASVGLGLLAAFAGLLLGRLFSGRRPDAATAEDAE